MAGDVNVIVNTDAFQRARDDKKSKDHIINRHGKRFMELHEEYGLTELNKRSSDDEILLVCFGFFI